MYMYIYIVYLNAYFPIYVSVYVNVHVHLFALKVMCESTHVTVYICVLLYSLHVFNTN